MLEAATTRIGDQTSEIDRKLDDVREEMSRLKIELYARFGKQINLET